LAVKNKEVNRMAVTSSPNNSRLTLVRQVGVTTDGKPILRSKSYNNIKWDATDEDVYAVGQALSGLSQNPAIEMIRYDNEILAEA
jgi:hypothetical protein